jgi:predicted nucleotidyltransferase
MTDTIQKQLRQFKNVVTKDYSNKSRVILFGSYAKGYQRKESDIDVAVIVPSVQDKFDEEINLRLKSLDIDERIIPLLFTQKDFEETTPLTWEIRNHGLEV